MSPKMTASLSELIDQLDAIIANYDPKNIQYSDGLSGYLKGLKQAKHLAENLIDKEL
jgi:hypothetical protein